MKIISKFIIFDLNLDFEYNKNKPLVDQLNENYCFYDENIDMEFQSWNHDDQSKLIDKALKDGFKFEPENFSLYWLNLSKEDFELLKQRIKDFFETK